MKNKNVVLYGVIALVAVVAVAFFTGTIPPKGNVEGTIGGANRYQSQQISDKDVILKDPQVQAFIQTDLFHQMQANPELMTTMTDNVRAALADKQVAAAYSDEAFVTMVKQHPGAVTDFMAAREQLKDAVESGAWRDLLLKADAAKVNSKAGWVSFIEANRAELAKDRPGVSKLTDFNNARAAELAKEHPGISRMDFNTANAAELAKGHPGITRLDFNNARAAELAKEHPGISKMDFNTANAAELAKGHPGITRLDFNNAQAAELAKDRPGVSKVTDFNNANGAELGKDRPTISKMMDFLSSHAELSAACATAEGRRPFMSTKITEALMSGNEGLGAAILSGDYLRSLEGKGGILITEALKSHQAEFSTIVGNDLLKPRAEVQ